MTTPLAAKLAHFAPLSDEDRRELERISRERVRRFSAREDLVREGERPTHVNLFLSGWACRYKRLRDGRRQIIAFLLPGDLCDHHVFVLREMDHSIGALTPVVVAQVSRRSLDHAVLSRPRIAQALWWETLVHSAIQREWTFNLGQRSAIERIAHLLCELFYRLRLLGLTNQNGCELPLTQADLAEATGMTPVHVNRTLQDLRAHGLIVLERRFLVLPDVPALKKFALFTPNYLHAGEIDGHLDAGDFLD